MEQKKITDNSSKPKAIKKEHIDKPSDPEDPLNFPVEDPDIVPDDDQFENKLPYEPPQPGEGP